ncbi:hypothetical protein DPMN_069061 [Dreissena polymorpha]|uniref:Uncharacterized protein n=1 Tax=Dreissena polymorpha TaxID=45954 RepID=A0A9D3Z0D9_DREPO|nr:hypothetical protein DPMN_069061 [Dreissena polymorpha]
MRALLKLICQPRGLQTLRYLSTETARSVNPSDRKAPQVEESADLAERGTGKIVLEERCSNLAGNYQNTHQTVHCGQEKDKPTGA